MISDLSLFRLIKHSEFALLIYQFDPGEKKYIESQLWNKDNAADKNGCRASDNCVKVTYSMQSGMMHRIITWGKGKSEDVKMC